MHAGAHTHTESYIRAMGLLAASLTVEDPVTIDSAHATKLQL